MAIITDSLHSTGNDYLLKMLGEKVFFPVYSDLT